MSIVGIGSETFLYVNGISTTHALQLADVILLLPINTELQFDNVSRLIPSDIDYSVAVLCAPNISSQLRVTSKNEETLGVVAWNAQWDCLLLGALFNCEVMCNLQCDKPIEKVSDATYFYVTNYAFHGVLKNVYVLTEDDESWLNQHYHIARSLLDSDIYLTAVHAMASYRWHSIPRVQLAILWSGIEALFNVSTEISFRISLYIAKFLSEQDDVVASEVFTKVRKLYNARSSAVHGGKIKGDLDTLVFESAQILNRLIRRCAESGQLPDVNKLIFNGI